MTPSKNAVGIIALVVVHLIWLCVPWYAGPQWLSLSPLFILLCCFIVGMFHPRMDSRWVFYLGIVYVAALTLSAMGVTTGRIFGSFFFGQNLGFQLGDTPLVIGVFWLLLSYCSSATATWFTQRFSVLNKPIITALLASVIMLIVDLLLEPVASTIDFWYWKNRDVPFQNYTAWFVFAFAYNFLFQQLEVDANNKIARWFMLLFLLWLIGLNLLQAHLIVA